MNTNETIEPTPSNGHEVVVFAEKITKRYPGTLALDQVDFTVHKGAVNVLIGENGAGKSTLMKVLAGATQPTSGTHSARRSSRRIPSPHARRRAPGSGSFFRSSNSSQISAFPKTSSSDAKSPEAGVVQHREQEKITRELLNRLEQPLDPSALVRDLRIGQQQIVEIAKALSHNVRVLIMDEPTSALTASETEALFRIIADLKADGVAIIYISHKMEELLTIGDYVTVLRDGKLAASAPARSVNVGWIVEKMVGRSVSAPRRRAPATTAGAPGKRLRNQGSLSAACWRWFHSWRKLVSSFKRGEILAIFGLMGAGRTELFECLMGLHPEATGEIKISNRALRSETIRERIDLGSDACA